MKFWKALKAAKALTEADAPAASTTAGQPGRSAMMAAFERIAEVFSANQIAMVGAERGAVLAGTSPDALQPAGPDGLAAGIAALRLRDPAFDPAALVTFACGVFTAVCQAWAQSEPAIARPVLADGMWQPMVDAQATLGGGIMTARMLAALTASGALIGLHSDDVYDSAWVQFTVQPPPGSPPEFGSFLEEWLFQRSVVPGGDPCTVAERCPGCGAVARPDPKGNCEFCHQPIPVLTVGWLATAVHSHNPLAEMALLQFVQKAREDPHFADQLPTFMLRQIPAATLAEVAPQAAARLRAEP